MRTLITALLLLTVSTSFALSTTTTNTMELVTKIEQKLTLNGAGDQIDTANVNHVLAVCVQDDFNSGFCQDWAKKVQDIATNYGIN